MRGVQWRTIFETKENISKDFPSLIKVKESNLRHKGSTRYDNPRVEFFYQKISLHNSDTPFLAKDKTRGANWGLILLDQ